MKETGSQASARRHERLFLLCAAAAAAVCILPNVGEKRAQALLEYRGTHGPFRHVADAAEVPGLSESIVASWDGLAYVS